MSKNTFSQKQDLENERIIQTWIERNSSSKNIIGQNHTGVIRPIKIINNNAIQPFSNKIIVSVTKKENTNNTIKQSYVLSNNLANSKRSSMEPNIVRTKIARWSSPAISIKIEPLNKSTPKSDARKSCSDLKSDFTFKKVPAQLYSSKYLKTKLRVQNNLANNKALTKKVEEGTKDRKVYLIEQKNVETTQSKNNLGIYNSLLDNYKYLLTPKFWSVTEFANALKQCIVYSKPYVIKENETLISVMQKSLIIDKNGKIYYSVHGLPVNTKGTILPDALDSMKKLLSILHIFDKMQVCKGLGDDLVVSKTDDSSIKDICQFWRHKDCKLLLIKADQCQICLDTRNILLEKEMLRKSEMMAMQYMGGCVKKEKII